MIKGAKQHNCAQLGLQSLSTFHVVVLQSWLIAQLEEVINQSSYTCHALDEHVASARNSILQTNTSVVLQSLLWTRRKDCCFTLKVVRQSFCCVKRPFSNNGAGEMRFGMLDARVNGEYNGIDLVKVFERFAMQGAFSLEHGRLTKFTTIWQCLRCSWSEATSSSATILVKLWMSHTTIPVYVYVHGP